MRSEAEDKKRDLYTLKSTSPSAETRYDSGCYNFLGMCLVNSCREFREITESRKGMRGMQGSIQLFMQGT